MAEQVLRDRHELVHLAVAAREQELQRLRRELLDRRLRQAEPLRVALLAERENVAPVQANVAGRRGEPRAAVAEAVEIFFDVDRRGLAFGDVVDVQRVGRRQVLVERRMHVQQRNHRRRRWELELDIVLGPNEHENNSPSVKFACTDSDGSRGDWTAAPKYPHPRTFCVKSSNDET